MFVYIHMNICHFAIIPLQKQLRWWQLRRVSSFAEHLLALPLVESRRESSPFPSGAAFFLWDIEQYVACVCVGTFVRVVHVSIFCACVFVCERETERIREGKGGRQKERERVCVRVLVRLRLFLFDCVWVPTTFDIWVLTEMVGKCVYGYLGVHGPDATVQSGLTIVSRHKQGFHWWETHAQQAQHTENVAHPIKALIEVGTTAGKDSMKSKINFPQINSLAPERRYVTNTPACSSD